MITRPISRSISSGVALAINDPSGAGFNPLSMFAAGEQGAWYDPSDMSTLYQDSAGTVPVTAEGQPVGMMRDKSGRGNHATQSTATSRPILQTTDGKWYLVFDGVDDFLVTANINLSSTNKLTVFSGFRKLSDAAAGWVTTFGELGIGSFSLRAPQSAGVTTINAHSSGTTSAVVTSGIIAAPVTIVGTISADIAVDAMALRINKTQYNSASDQGTGNYGTFPLYVGKRNAIINPFNGNLYGLIVRGATSTPQQITDTEIYMNSKTGAY